MNARGIVTALVSFLVGIVLGMLSALSTFSGRMSALETTAAQHNEALRDIRTDLRLMNAQLQELRARP